jgi:hypothetical protein
LSSISFLKNSHRRLHRQHRYTDAVFEWLAHAGFDCEGSAVLACCEVSEIQAFTALAGIEPEDAALKL